MRLERLYLDYNATSPLSASVLDWLKSGDVLFANPASQHSSGKSSRKSINEARAEIYKTFSQSEKDSKLFFHSGATEGILTLAYSFSEWARKENRKLLICYSGVDHPAVLSLKDRYYGEHVSFYELSRKLDLSYHHEENLAGLRKLKQEDPDLIILYHHLWVHNEVGTVSPLEELRPFKEMSDLYLHVDGVQAPGKIPEWQSLSVGDAWTFSAHKFGALKGIGFSFLNKNIPFSPLMTGGGQQQSMRSGTENPQGVMSIALALGDLKKVNVAENIKSRMELENFLTQELKNVGEVIGGEQRKNANTIYFYLNNLTSDIALALFDLEGLEISAGSACSSGAAKPSAVLMHMGLHQVAKNGLRLSFGYEMDQQSMDLLKTKFSAVINKIRSHLNP